MATEDSFAASDRATALRVKRFTEQRANQLLGGVASILTPREPLRVPAPLDETRLGRNINVKILEDTTAALLETAVNDFLHEITTAGESEKRIIDIDWRTDASAVWVAFITYAE